MPRKVRNHRSNAEEFARLTAGINVESMGTLMMLIERRKADFGLDIQHNFYSGPSSEDILRL